MKKIRGQIHYFGAWARRLEGVLVPVEGGGWKEALEDYKKVADDLHAGRTPRVRADGGLTVAVLCNHFLTAKLRKVEAGEMTTATFADYRLVTDSIVSQFGAGRLVDDLAADDFAALRAAMVKRWGPVRLANSITRVKSVFKYGFDSGLMERPVRFGPEFVKPSQAAMRKHKAKRTPRLLEAAELRGLIAGKVVEREGGAKVLARPDAALKAMILLGLNCGFGNTDVAELTTAAVNLEAGWIDFPRPKTGVARRCPLWPETVEALRGALAVRPKPAQPRDVGRVFLSEDGTMLVRRSAKGHKTDLVGKHFTRLLEKQGLRREGLGFYLLRHCFRTAADGAKDQPAADLIMGHTDPSMAAHYRERIEDERLRAVANHVRNWLWPDLSG
jgi:integrase